MAVWMSMTTISMVHGAPALLCLRVFVPQARPSGQVCSEHQPSCLPRVPSLVCAHFLRTSAEKKGARMSAEQGQKSRFLASSPAPPEPRRRARHASRTSLAHSTRRMLCVNTHNPTGPSRAKRDVCASHCRRLSQEGLGPTNSRTRILNTFQRSVQCHDRAFEVLFPQFPISVFQRIVTKSHHSGRCSLYPHCL